LCDAHFVSEPSNRHGLSLCDEYNPKQVRWFNACARNGSIRRPKGQTPARKRAVNSVLSHTAHFRNALDALVPSGAPSGELAGHGRRPPRTASSCRALPRTFQCIRSYLAVFAGLSCGDGGSGQKNSGSCLVRQRQCDWFAVPLPGVSPIVSSSFEQNLPSAPSWPQALRSFISQSMGFGR
jgi:hypothetical protein